jgi:hypothetical protein
VLVWWLYGSRGRADRHVRVDIPARHLGGRVRQPPRQAWIDELHADGGTAVFTWPTVDAELDAMNRCRHLGARVVLDVDDNPFSERTAMVAAINNIKTAHTRAELRRQLEQEHRRQGMCVSALRHADAVTCASPALADVCRRHNPNVHVVPNQIDPDDWPDLVAHAQQAAFRVGFAGSTSHAYDIHLIRDALHWASSQDQVEVHFHGWHPSGPLPEADHLEFDEHVMHGRYTDANAIVARNEHRWDFPITVTDWTDDYRTHARNLTGLDIGLCPGDDTTVFTPWRSDLKPLEYLMAGVLPIISRSQALKDWWDLVPTASNAQEFLCHVQRAVENRDDAHAHAMELRDHVLAERTIQANLWRWREALQPTALAA